MASIGWLTAYVVVLALVVGGVRYMRGVAIAVYGTPQAQTEWDTWREDVKELEKQPYPVKRRTPKSAEPPALVLMRDYFGVCLAIAVVLSSVLFGTFMVMVRGATQSRVGFAHHDSAKRGGHSPPYKND
ncbi:MAG TPA: hypothetical protein VGI40_17835 [Pirellulaceae bacterium]